MKPRCSRGNVLSFCQRMSTLGTRLSPGWEPSSYHIKLILTQVIVSLQALTSLFGYNYLPRSGILSAFVTETPALPDEINLSYFLCRNVFPLPLTDLILTAQQSTAAQGVTFTCRAAELFFFFRVDHLQAYLCE